MSDPISIIRHPFCSTSAISEGAGRAGINLDSGILSWAQKSWTQPQCPAPLEGESTGCFGLEPYAGPLVPACPQEPSPAPPAPLAPPASSGLTLLFCSCFSEVELPLKKDGFTSESTTLEALLRGEGVEKKVDTREEENIQEIQVFLCPLQEEGALSTGLGPPLQGQAASQVASRHLT